MSSSAARGAVLVAVAVLLGFFVLRGAEDRVQAPLADGAVSGPAVDATAVPGTDTEGSDSASLDGTPPAAATTTVVDPATARSNGEVTVLVVNGTEVSGQASRLTSALQNQGFITREPKNTSGQATSVIYYRPGFAAEATVVRNVLRQDTPIAPMPEPDPVLGEGIDLAPVNVLVLVGADGLSTS